MTKYRNTNCGSETYVDGTHIGPVNPKADWDAYDRLPKIVRKAIQDGTMEWDCSSIAAHMYGRGMKLKAKQMAYLVNQKNREIHVASFPGIEEYLVANDKS